MTGSAKKVDFEHPKEAQGLLRPACRATGTYLNYTHLGQHRRVRKTQGGKQQQHKNHVTPLKTFRSGHLRLDAFSPPAVGLWEWWIRMELADSLLGTRRNVISVNIKGRGPWEHQ